MVCAYTPARWDDLAAGVRTAAAQLEAPGHVVVVIDHHDQLLAKARAELGRTGGRDQVGIEVLANTRTRGLSGARNTAIAAASGQVVVFLDDDAVPGPDWLASLLAAYADPGVVAVGGAADPVWPVRRPDHLVPELDWIVGCTYTGLPLRRGEVRNLMGCNMSFRREVFEAVGGFDESAGRIGAIPLGCEETELCIRVRQQLPGSRIVLEPAARVDHRVSPDRTTWAYLRSRSSAEGFSKAAMASQVGAGDATSVERDYVRRVLTAGVRRELAAGLRGQRSGWRGAAGIVTALGATTAGYARGRWGRGGAAMRRAEAARGPAGPAEVVG